MNPNPTQMRVAPVSRASLVREVFALCLLLPLTIFAQSSPATPSTLEQEVISLDPYLVQQSSEAGYRATQTTSANRINMPIKEVPMNIPVLTEEFIKDVASSGHREALQWLAGVDDRRVRGFNTVDFLSNGFIRNSDFSAANIERIEILRGPSAVLDGVTSPGGIINVITKKPLVGRQFLNTTLRYGHPNERFFTSVDANFSAGPKLEHGNLITARVIGSYEHTLSGIRGPLQTLLVRYGEDEEAMISPSLLIKPTKDTTITLEYEYWNHNYGVQDEQNTAFRLIMPGANFANGEIPLAVALGIPPERSWTGPDLGNFQNVSTGLVSIDHQFSKNFSANVAYNLQKRANPFTAEPRISTVLVGGVPTIRREWRKNERDTENRSFRANLFYRWELAQTEHRLVAGYQTLKFKSDAPFAMATVHGTASTNYADFFDPLVASPDLRLDESKFFWRFLRLDQSRTENTSYFVNHQGRFFDDKLITLVGGYQSESKRTLGLPNENDVLLPQTGFVWFFKPENGFFANWAKSMEPNLTAQDGFGNPLNPTYGEVFEAGVKLSFWKGRGFLTASAYEIKQKDRIQFDPLAPNRDNPTANPSLPRGANIPVGEITSRGIDLDGIFYPARNWSVIATYSYNDTFISRDINTALIGRQVNATFEHKWSIWNKYVFTEGALAGVFVGGGVQWRGDKLRSYRNNATGVPTPAFQKPNTRVDLLMGYKRKAYGVPVTLSLNAKNLTKGEALTSGNQFVFGFKPGTNYGYYFTPKIEYVFSALFEF